MRNRNDRKGALRQTSFAVRQRLRLCTLAGYAPCTRARGAWLPLDPAAGAIAPPAPQPGACACPWTQQQGRWLPLYPAQWTGLSLDPVL